MTNSAFTWLFRFVSTGIRQELLVWDMETGDLVKRMTAHFQRIVEIKSLVVGTNNEIITSSIDRCIKIWNLDYIFEKERHIDKHELTIDALSISTTAGIAVTVTRSCLGKLRIFIKEETNPKERI